MAEPPVPSAADPHELPAPAVLARLVPYLTQSIMVVRRDWTVMADLTPPGGLLGRGNAVGSHPFSSMHPDDVERVAAVAEQAMHSEPGWTSAFDLRAQKGDGSYGVYRVELHNRFDDPVLDGIVVVAGELEVPADDDTPSLPAEVAAQLRMGVVGEHLPIGLILLDERGDVVFANQVACDLLDTDTAALLDGRMPEGIEAVDAEEILAILRRLRATPGRESFTLAFDGRVQRLLSGTFVSRTAEGSGGDVRFVLVTVEDITHRHARERHLEHRANHDSLTGLPNRAWLLDHLSERLGSGAAVLVAFVDLDGFKAVNDRLGHAAGDELLADIAAQLRGSLGPGETVARVGGDEFVVVAEVGDGAHVTTHDDLRERVRRAVRASTGGRDHAVGVSVGVTESRPDDRPWDLLGRADAAMYGDKRRNG